jgi:hypothetical protein
MALKLLHLCAACDKAIDVSVSDPVISSMSLGPGFFHERCAKEKWENQKAGREAHQADVSAKRSEAAKSAAKARGRSCISCGTRIEEGQGGGRECSECVNIRQASEVEDG